MVDEQWTSGGGGGRLHLYPQKSYFLTINALRYFFLFPDPSPFLESPLFSLVLLPSSLLTFRLLASFASAVDGDVTAASH